MKLKEVLTPITENVRGKIEIKKIPIEMLDSMLDYQRDIDMEYVNENSKDGIFNENEVSIVLVSVQKNGSMKVCDGQHTIAILKKRGYTMVKCELRYGLTNEEENDWFNIENSKRRGQSNKRLLTTAINGTYEKHKDEQDFYNCLKSLGYKLNIYSEESGIDCKINCTSSLLSLYKDYVKNENKDNFIECMDILKTCFKGDPISLQWSFIRGLFDFYETYKNEFDKKRLITVLSEYNVKAIRNDVNLDLYSCKTSVKYAKAFVIKYNFKIAKSKRLKISKLDD